MSKKTDAPHIFVSYSWKPLTNKKRTIEIAERLFADGVHVIIDEWDLMEGQDKYKFMEQMVTNPDIKRVLLICNKEYADKANKKKGGVGAESLIISDEIYKKADQKKFIPIIMERDENGNEYLPTFLKTRIYIDFSMEDIFEDQYEKLLRNIFDKPSVKRPILGTPPSFIVNEEPIFLPTAHKVKTVKTAFINNKSNAWVFVDDYFDSFLSSLEDFEITNNDLIGIQNIDNEILKRIEQMLHLRDDFIEFLNVVLKYTGTIDTERFHRYLEKLVEYLMSNDGWSHPANTFGYLRLDHFRFFYYELFLHLAALFIYYEKYLELGYLLHNSFIIFNKHTQKTEQYYFTIFNISPNSLNKLRNERLNLKLINYCADLVKQRAKSDIYINFNTLLEIDMLLYYISLIENVTVENEYQIMWFPQLTTYGTNQIQILQKLISKRYFEKMKPIFGVQDEEELKQKINKIIEIDIDKIPRWDYFVPSIQRAFNIEKLGKIK